MKFIGLIYMIWPAILWIVWGGMTLLGYEGWFMDLLFVVSIAFTTVMAVIAVLVTSFMSRF